MRVKLMIVAAILSGISLAGSTGISVAQPVAPTAGCGDSLDSWLPQVSPGPDSANYSDRTNSLTIKKDLTLGFSKPGWAAKSFPNGTKFKIETGDPKKGEPSKISWTNEKGSGTLTAKCGGNKNGGVSSATLDGKAGKDKLKGTLQRK
ncbi:hypothetical protein ACH4YO_41980 [Streptomyces noursei]|uniref:hypothetical protein n=1 Tax=Streptomyces noursei TaxID=1971 RepID=UPI0033EAE817